MSLTSLIERIGKWEAVFLSVSVVLSFFTLFLSVTTVILTTGSVAATRDRDAAVRAKLAGEAEEKLVDDNKNLALIQRERYVNRILSYDGG